MYQGNDLFLALLRFIKRIPAGSGKEAQFVKNSIEADVVAPLKHSCVRPILCRQSAEFAELVIRNQAQYHAKCVLCHLHKSSFFEQQVIARMAGEHLIHQRIQTDTALPGLVLERVVHVLLDPEVTHDARSRRPLSVKSGHINRKSKMPELYLGVSTIILK